MPLVPGSKLGPYEIVAPLGAGGWGEVVNLCVLAIGHRGQCQIQQEFNDVPEFEQLEEREVRRPPIVRDYFFSSI
jgi:hypothetical protein